MRALIVGASGFNGGALARRLTQDGHHVRGLVRDPARAPRAILDEVVRGDAVTGDGLRPALEGMDVAFYFVHSLDPGSGTAHERDLRAARHFARAARDAGLPRAVYFTTLAPPNGATPPSYQRNRLAVEELLLEEIPGMTVLRGGLVLGSGSRSLRAYYRLVRRSAVLPLGPWRRRRIAVVDTAAVNDCFVRAGTDPALAGGSFDVPASAEPTHEELVREITDVLDVRRRVLRLPATNARVDARLVAWITGESYEFCRNLLTVNRHDYLVDPARAAPFADVRALPLRPAVAGAVLDWQDLPRYGTRPSDPELRAMNGLGNGPESGHAAGRLPAR